MVTPGIVRDRDPTHGTSFLSPDSAYQPAAVRHDFCDLLGSRSLPFSDSYAGFWSIGPSDHLVELYAHVKPWSGIPVSVMADHVRTHAHLADTEPL